MQAPVEFASALQKNPDRRPQPGPAATFEFVGDAERCELRGRGRVRVRLHASSTGPSASMSAKRV